MKTMNITSVLKVMFPRQPESWNISPNLSKYWQFHLINYLIFVDLPHYIFCWFYHYFLFGFLITKKKNPIISPLQHWLELFINIYLWFKDIIGLKWSKSDRLVNMGSVNSVLQSPDGGTEFVWPHRESCACTSQCSLHY